MSAIVQITAAKQEDAARLTEIAVAAKRHWGYPAVLCFTTLLSARRPWDFGGLRLSQIRMRKVSISGWERAESV